MSINLDLKLRGQLSRFPHLVRSSDQTAAFINTCSNNHLNTQIITDIEKNEENSLVENCERWAYAARASCIIALVPMLLFTKNETLTKSAACAHLLLTPATSFFLQNFSYARCIKKQAKIVSCLLCGICLTLGNCAAVTLLLGERAFLANCLLSTALCIGSVQLLMVLHKGNVIRVMACTAAAVMVVVLAILASAAPSNMARRFFQSAALPFLLLFLETSRLPIQL